MKPGMNRPVLRNLGLALALALALAGCTLAPEYERPAAPVDSAYPSGPAYGENRQGARPGLAAADIGWRDFFADPLLQRLISTALQANRDLRVAALNVQEARAQYRIERAGLLPGVAIGGQGTVQRQPGDLTPSGQSGISRTYQVGGLHPGLGTGPVRPHPQPERPGIATVPGAGRDPH